VDVPAASTITRILRHHDFIDEAQSQQSRAWKRFEHAQPNRLWQIDFKGNFPTLAGMCYPLTMLDDHSRFNLILEACAQPNLATVQQHLIRA
ncbi:IS481 family transposase, partial [Actimicrobium sp. CCI2.3]|nr:IS481 family transposase [Actimicrobium sp. CCI2.3]